MKIVLFNDYTTSTQKAVNEWLDKNKNVKIEDVKLSSCCSSSGSVYTQIMIVYSELDTAIKL